MTQVSANIRTPLETVSGSERPKAGNGGEDAAGEFAKLVKEAGSGGRKASPDAEVDKARQMPGQKGDPAVKAGDTKVAANADGADVALNLVAGGETEPTAIGRDKPAQDAAVADSPKESNRQEIVVMRPAGPEAVDRGSVPEIATKAPDKAMDTEPAKQAVSDEPAQPAKDADAVQTTVTGPAPVVAVMAVAPYLTARTAPADASAKPAAPQPQKSAIEVDRVATGETIDAPVARAQTGSSRAEAIAMAFGARNGGSDGGVQSANAQAGGAQPITLKAGAVPGEGAAIPVAASATPPAGGDPRPSQPIVVPLDLGRALAGEGDLPSSMREAVSSHVARVMATPVAGQPVSVLRIQLQPAHLGQINVTMRMSGEQMTVTLTPDSASAARALGSDQETIATVLRAVGGSFAAANIEVAGEGQVRTGADDAASRGPEGRQGERSGEGSHGTSRGDHGRSGADGLESGQAAAHGGASASSGEGRIII